jgi:hypothetical protein
VIAQPGRRTPMSVEGKSTAAWQMTLNIAMIVIFGARNGV